MGVGFDKLYKTKTFVTLHCNANEKKLSVKMAIEVYDKVMRSFNTPFALH